MNAVLFLGSRLVFCRKSCESCFEVSENVRECLLLPVRLVEGFEELVAFDFKSICKIWWHINEKVFNIKGKEHARQKVCTENNSVWLEHMINSSSGKTVSGKAGICGKFLKCWKFYSVWGGEKWCGQSELDQCCSNDLWWKTNSKENSHLFVVVLRKTIKMSF